MHESPPGRPARPLRILHLTLAADPGGLSRYITNLGAALVERGHQVTAAGDEGAWRWAFDEAPFPYLPIPLKAGPVGLWKSARRLREWLAANPVDLIHAHYRRAVLLGRRLQKSAPGGRRPPLLYTLHLSHIEIGGWRRWFSDFGDHTHVASADAGQWLVDEAGVPEDRITLIPHGIEVGRFPRRTEADRQAARRQLGLPPDAVVAAYVGRLDSPKNEAWCMDVLPPAHQAGVNLHLVYAGEGPGEAALRDFVVRAGLGDRVHLLGHRDPLPVYQAADLLLLPSEREGFSLVCAEAMSVGVPHVRTRTSGATELTIDNVTGQGVPIDRRAFAGAAARLLAQPQLLAEMGENGARLIRDRFTFDRQVEDTIGLYRRLAGRA